LSAGAICWFESGVTDSFGPALQPLTGGLALLPGSFCPHYDNEAARRPAFHALVGSGRLAGGYAADDSAAILFEDERVADVVQSRRGAHAYHVIRKGEAVSETTLEARLLDR
jgi:dipeptidase E